MIPTKPITQSALIKYLQKYLIGDMANGGVVMLVLILQVVDDLTQAEGHNNVPSDLGVARARRSMVNGER